ncbi:Cloroperoxidase [Coprinopsis marcescibilis]|uniref:Cloroperoxidase n=1 Tax=Coprinopsis marcescibilis TaxID=230819 RepID=A0A5C3KEX4_COPMA|nr:Cloroperoxidase [Coprinopsis marcescibilis]
MRFYSLSIFVSLVVHCTPGAFAFSSYTPLGGLSARDLERIVPTLKAVLPPPPPGPPAFTGTKLVDDRDHPWKPLRSGDQRGPCPGLNVLASHGYLPRNGIATPAQLIIATQDGFNFDNIAARVAAYSGMLLSGNLVTDLLSIGAKTSKTGPDPPPPATVAGLNTHGAIEGDASMSRGDAFFGDNHSFNQTLWNQFADFSNRFGNGFYNYTVAGQFRKHLIEQSIAENPQFSLMGFNHFGAYGTSVLPINMFVDGRKTDSEAGQLDLVSALSIFRDMRYPRGFFRRAVPGGGEGVLEVFLAAPTSPGRNNGTVGSFVADDSLGGFTDPCKVYTEFVNTAVRGLYPSPTGVLRRNLNLNLGFFYDAFSVAAPDCPQLFPYGRN